MTKAWHIGEPDDLWLECSELDVSGERGQVLPLAVGGVFILCLAVLTTLNLGQAVHERIKLQNAADSAAYSIAAMEARTFNYIAFLNRAQIAHYNIAMVAQSYLSWTGFEVARLSAGLDLVATQYSWLAAWQLRTCANTAAAVPCTMLRAATSYLAQAVRDLALAEARALLAYQSAEKLGHQIVSAMSIFNKDAVWQAQASRAALTYLHLLSTLTSGGVSVYALKNDANINTEKTTPLGFLANAANLWLYSNAFDTSSGGDPSPLALVSLLSSVSGRNPFSPGKLGRVGDLGATKNQQRMQQAYRVMAELCNASRWPSLVFDRSSSGGFSIGLGQPWLRQAAPIVGMSKRGQTKFVEDGNTIGGQVVGVRKPTGYNAYGEAVDAAAGARARAMLGEAAESLSGEGAVLGINKRLGTRMLSARIRNYSSKLAARAELALLGKQSKALAMGGRNFAVGRVLASDDFVETGASQLAYYTYNRPPGFDVGFDRANLGSAIAAYDQPTGPHRTYMGNPAGIQAALRSANLLLLSSTESGMAAAALEPLLSMLTADDPWRSAEAQFGEAVGNVVANTAVNPRAIFLQLTQKLRNIGSIGDSHQLIAPAVAALGGAGLAPAVTCVPSDPACHAYWPGFAPYYKFNASGDRSQDFNQPSTFVVLNKDLEQLQRGGGNSGERRKPWFYQLLWRQADRAAAIDTTAGGEGGLLGMMQLGRGLNAIARGMVYYHRPGSWAEQPNFFNPFWRARLAPVAQVVERLWDMVLSNRLHSSSTNSVVRGAFSAARNVQMELFSTVITSMVTH